MPAVSTVYLGDTARVPYGPKSPDTVRRYANEAAGFLTGRGVRALVVACNTATAHASRALREILDIPVVGVVQPGATAAAAATTSGRIGVIGTRGTIESGTYERAIVAVRPDAEVHSVACPLFVALAEEGWLDGEVAELTAREYLTPLLEREIDTLLLGCTHYPLLAPLLARVVGDGVSLVDSAQATAGALADVLGEPAEGSEPGDPIHAYCVTDDERRFGEIADRFLGAPARQVERVSIEEGPAGQAE